MSQIIKLREKRVEIWDKAKSFLDAKRNEDGLLSTEDTEQYEKMELDVVNLGKEIERLERQATIDQELSKPTSNVITNTPNNNIMDTKIGRASNDYKKDFWNNMRTKNGVITNALQIGEDGEGGYLAPDEFEKILIEALEEENIFRKLAFKFRTSSGDRKIPVSSAKGTASWIDEEGEIPESDDSFGQASMGAFKLGTLIKVSEELLNDSVFNLPTYIAKEFARRIGAREEEGFFIGDGTGKPTGLLNDIGGAEIGVTTSTATSIKFDDVIDLFYSLKSPYRKSASFLTNDSTIKAIRKLKDNNGQYLWQPSARGGEPDRILNKPVETSTYVPNIGSGEKVMTFGDYGYYWIADRQGRSFKRLNELFATRGQVGFLSTERVDGKLILPEAVKVLKMAGGGGGA